MALGDRTGVLKKILVWLVRGLATLLILAILSIALAHTSWGFALAKSFVLPSLSREVFAGELKVGELEGFLGSDFTLTRVVLTDETGEPAYAVPRLRIRWDLFALLAGRVRVHEVIIESPRVMLRPGDLGGVAAIVPPRPADEAPTPSAGPPSTPIPIVVEDVRLLDGRFEMVEPEIEVEGIGLAGRFAFVEAALTAEVAGLDAQLQTKTPGRLSVEGRYQLVEGEHRLTASATVARARLQADGVRWDGETVPLGQVQVNLPEGFLAAWFGRPDVDLRLSALSAPDPERQGGIAWRVEADAGETTLRARGLARGDGTEFEARLRDLPPRLLSPEAPKGMASARLDGRLLLQPLRGDVRTTATATLTVPRTQTQVRLRTVAEAELDRKGDLSARVQARGAGASADVAAELSDLLVAPVLRRLDLSVATQGLERLPIPGDPEGAVEAEATWVEGEWTGRAQLARLRLGSLRIAKLSAEASGRGLDLEGELQAQELEVGRFRQRRTLLRVRPSGPGKRFVLTSTGALPLRQVALSGTGRIGWPLDLRLDEGQVVTGTSTWSFEPWRLRVNAKEARAEGFEASTPRSRLTLDGRARWRPAMSGSARVEADMEALSDLAFLVPSVRDGSLRSSAAFDWTKAGLTGETSGNAEISVRQVPTPLDLRFKAVADPARIQAGGQVDGGELGRVAFDVAAMAPPELEAWGDGPGWLKRLELVDAALDEARLDAWTQLVGVEGVEGLANGALRLEGDGLDGRLRVEGLKHRTMRAPLSLALAAKGDADGTTLGGEVRADIPIGTLSATVARSWREADQWPSADGEARVAIDQVTMARFADFVRLPEPFDAPVGGSLRVEANLTRRSGRAAGALSLAARDVEPYPASPQIDVDVGSVLDGRAWTATATVAAVGLGRAVTSLRGRPPWETPRPEAVVLQVSDLQVTGLRALYPVPILQQGRMNGRLTWTEGGDRGSTRFRLRDARIFEGQPPFTAAFRADVQPTHIDFEFGAFEDALAVAGRLRRQGDDPLAWPLDALVGGRRLPLRALVPVRAADGVGGGLALTATVAGALSKPRADFVLDAEGTEVANVRFDRARFEGHYDSARLSLTGTVAQSSDGRLGLVAQIDEDRLEAKVDADALDLGFLTVAAGIIAGPVGSFDGKLSGRVDAQGSRRDPDVNGDLRIDDLDVVLPGQLPSVEDGVAKLAFSNGDFKFSSRGGSSAGGRFGLNAKGQVEGPEIEGHFDSKDLRYLAGPIVTEITTEVDYQLRGRDAEVLVHRTKIRLPEESSTTLHDIDPLPDVVQVQTFGVRPKPEPPPEPPAPGDEPRLRLRVRNDDDITFRGVDAQGSATLDLRVEEFGGMTRINGDASVPRGQIEVLGKTYQVERAVVSFTGKVPTDPRLDIQLAHAFRTMTLFVYITGSASAPEVRFGASPSDYDQAQLTAFFTGLQNPDTPGRASGEGGAAGSVGQALLGPAIAEVRRQLPIDTLDIDTNGGAAVITVGKWISETVFVAAGYDGSRSGGSAYEGTLRWRFTPRWVLEVLASLESQSADVLWTKRF